MLAELHPLVPPKLTTSIELSMRLPHGAFSLHEITIGAKAVFHSCLFRLVELVECRGQRISQCPDIASWMQGTPWVTTDTATARLKDEKESIKPSNYFIN